MKQNERKLLIFQCSIQIRNGANICSGGEMELIVYFATVFWGF